eukprot:TRINITY_DN105886_c0_g1_i1.p1 TRINITY_DN105886_c0_g1~~TRINITY_DN105886_c0_g1_i1.p1  ORF type:complete len:451 (-),score=169.09 TRINITY_DN105886_c0_g1_i1:184-1536(-)
MAPKRRKREEVEEDEEETVAHSAAKKRPSARVLKRPAAEEHNAGDEVEEEEEEDEGSEEQADNDDQGDDDDGVKKRPSRRNMKRPAAAQEEEAGEEDEEEDDDDDDEEEEEDAAQDNDDDDENEVDDEVRKRPSALMKRPSAAAEEGSRESADISKKPASSMDDEENRHQTEPESASAAAAAARLVKQDHRAAVLAVRQKQRFIEKLETQREALAQKTKGINAALRQAHKELEDLKDVSRRKGRALATVNSRKKAQFMEKKAQQASRIHSAAQKTIKATRKRIGSAEASWKAANDKLEVAESHRRQQQARLADAEKKCQALKAKKEYVPDPDDTSDWKFSHKSAPLAPGVAAAKALHFAKEALAKGTGEWKRMKDLADEKERKFRAAKEQLKKAKEKQQTADSMLNQTRVGKPSESKAIKSKSVQNAAKAMKKATTSMKKVMKSMKQSKS